MLGVCEWHKISLPIILHRYCTAFTLHVTKIKGLQTQIVISWASCIQILFTSDGRDEKQGISVECLCVWKELITDKWHEIDVVNPGHSCSVWMLDVTEAGDASTLTSALTSSSTSSSPTTTSTKMAVSLARTSATTAPTITTPTVSC